MAIVQADIQYLLSGGASNTDPNASIGGAISSTAAGTNIFDNVSSAEATAGSTEYRCVYIKNNTGGGLTWSGAKVWISSPDGSGGAYAGDTITIAIGNAAVSATETAVANETTAPSPALTFVAAASEGAALQLNSTTGLAAGAYRAVWIKRVIAAGAAAASNAGFTLTAKGDTAA
jgi:hypothetical protein